jgi:hypothetical protein
MKASTFHLAALVSLLALALIAIPVVAAQQPPALPQAFFGTVQVNGAPGAAGIQVEARGTGVLTGLIGNPLTTTEKGKYGGRTLYDAKLVVQGSLESGAAIAFFVNGVQAECAVPGGEWRSSYPFRSGDVTELNLKVGKGAAMSGTTTPTVTPSQTPSPGTSPVTEATSTVRPASRQAEATPTVRPTRTPTAVVVPTQPVDAPSPEAAASPSVPIAAVASPTDQPVKESVAVVIETAVPTAVIPAAVTSVPTDAAESATPTLGPTQPPALVANQVKATARPILAPLTPQAEVQPSAGPATDASLGDLMLWLGIAILGAAFVGGTGIVIYTRFR